MLKIIKRIEIVLFIVMTIVILTIISFRCINANKSKIKNENGIQESTYVKIGGIEQYVQIRGENVKNPIILWLHGGPGYPLTYLTYYYQSALESDYTIVCWEQRGCGRTYYKNHTEELSFEILLKDTDELVDYLCKRFEQNKIIIIGQSWGTVLGSTYITRYPEKVAAYIGVGQVIDFDRGKAFAAEKAIEAAEKNGNYDDAEKLQKALSIFKQSSKLDELDIKNLERMILLSLKYLKSDEEISGIKQFWLGISSPYMNFNDFRWFFNASNTKKIFELEKPLIQYMYYDFDINKLGTYYSVPVYYIQGDSDWITPNLLVYDYYETINSPDKSIAIIQEAGHTPFLDRNLTFCKEVKKVLKRLEGDL